MSDVENLEVKKRVEELISPIHSLIILLVVLALELGPINLLKQFLGEVRGIGAHGK